MIRTDSGTDFGLTTGILFGINLPLPECRVDGVSWDKREEGVMTEAQGIRLGKLIFWTTLTFCSWIIWYISAPPT